MKLRYFAFSIACAPSLSLGVTVLKLSPQDPDLLVETDPSVDSFSIGFDDNQGFTGSDRFFYTMTGSRSFTESLSLSSATSNYELTAVTWDFIQFGSDADNYVSIELLINGVSAGSETTEGLANANFLNISWDVTGVVPETNEYEFVFNVSEVGTSTSFFELVDSGGRDGLLIEGNVLPIPEPSTILLLGLSGIGLCVRRRSAR